MQRPAELREAIGRALEGVGRAELGEPAKRLSRFYRQGSASTAAVRDAMDALAYVVVRTPATFVAVGHVLFRLQERCGRFQPPQRFGSRLRARHGKLGGRRYLEPNRNPCAGRFEFITVALGQDIGGFRIVAPLARRKAGAKRSCP